ncbi:HD domain-containing phosphohydrolase [Zoogloea sp.]|uniref:HD domain-containing phosphohydrolase n=1 Tax=Zoogloea sp. TaxID=49181 RepID=UPI0026270699|nr:HD domain-containing phosphohydrolase [Zoogloea sp.]MDD3352266.1 HD domain-containing protein [Zoogloea sp.]
MAADSLQDTPLHRRRFPLHLHISSLFFLLLLVAGGSIAWLSYARSADMLERAAGDLMVRIVRQTAAETEALLQPVGSAMGLLALQPLTRAGTLEARWTSLPLLREVLAGSPSVSSCYVGYDNGDFFLLMRFVSDEDRRQLGAPADSAYVVQSIAGEDGRFVFLDAALEVLATDRRADYARNYDPRQRDWYRLAQAQAGAVQTAPYLFAATRKPGVTIARQASGGHAVVGADIRLATLDETLDAQRITPGSRLVLFDGAQQVIAYSERGWLHGDENDRVSRPRVDALEAGLLAGLLRPGVKSGEGLYAFTGAGRAWRGAVVPLPVLGNGPIHLGVAVPDAEFLVEARAIRDRSILITLAVILLALPLSYLAARLVSRPIRELAGAAAAIRRFDFSSSVSTRSVVREVDDLAEDLASMKGAIRRFLDIASVMAAETDFGRLLARVVDETVGVLGARAGVLFLTRDGEEGLEAMALRNAHGESLPLEGLPAGGAVGSLVAPGQRSGVVQISGEGSPWRSLLGALESDRMACLALPLQDREGMRLGMLVLWFESPPEEDKIRFAEALSGSAAVSLETRALIEARKELFESFVRLIAGAIDAKSRYTGGHCARVPVLAQLLAEAACAATEGPYTGFQMSEDDREALHLASWLHDCGKVTTPEFVVDKATKLETLYDRIHEIRTRFEVLKRDAEVACWRRIAEGAVREEALAALAQEWRVLDEEFAFVAACNLGSEQMDPAAEARLRRIAARTWLRTLDDRLGVSPEERLRKGDAPSLPVLETVLADKPEHRIAREEGDRILPDNPWGFRMPVPELLYHRGELRNLTIPRGTLGEEERFKINEHIIQTIRMLDELPFPRHLRAVPEIAGGHHERMDGGGYPRGLGAAQMSPLARMMAIADVFEALTAVDRPYKRGKTLSEAVGIMARMRDNGHIDPDLFALFVRSGVCRAYAERFMDPAAVDEVDLAALGLA